MINEEGRLPSGWSLKPIGDVLLSSQYGLSLPAEATGNIPIVGMKDLQNGHVEIEPTQKVSVTDEEFNKYQLLKGDILLNRTNSPDLVGKAGIVKQDSKAVFASYLVRLKVDKIKAVPAFITFLLNSELGQRKLKSLSTRAISQANINPTVFRKQFSIPIPPIKEQEQIAAILSTWDEAIEKMERLIEGKRLRHAELSNKLLSNKSKDVPLKKFLSLAVREVARPDKPYWALGIRSHCKGTFRRFVGNPNAVAMDTLYRVQHDDIIVNITFAWEGAIALVKEADEDCLVSHRFPTFEVDTNKALPEYLRHVIVQKNFIRKLALISPGGAGRNRVLNKKDFLNLKIPLPELDEQKRVGNVLNASLKEILLLKAQLELFKKQKRGLMQKVLTGKWRVKFSEEVK